MNTFSTCIFDLDGTLVNSLADLANSTNSALAALGYPSHPIDNYRYFVGRGVAKLIEVSLPEEARTKEIALEARRLFDEHYSSHYLDNTHPYDGITDLLTALQNKHIRLAVVSNKPQIYVDKIVHHLFPAVFSICLGQRLGIPRKPDPTGVLEACSALGATAQSSLYVGDSGLDMQTAVAAGCYPVGVLWGFRAKPELESNGAKALVSTPAELLAYI
ncbi:MAG: HAD-superfamily hydrolase, subfamily variant 3 [Firmicutes bacterium]|nr:HAD-superfamily hydrolase, subfamily variant 3 [Bacillota bacterium]